MSEEFTDTLPMMLCGYVSGLAAGLTASVYVALVPVQPFASVTVTTMGKVPV